MIMTAASTFIFVEIQTLCLSWDWGGMRLTLVVGVGIIETLTVCQNDL